MTPALWEDKNVIVFNEVVNSTSFFCSNKGTSGIMMPRNIHNLKFPSACNTVKNMQDNLKFSFGRAFYVIEEFIVEFVAAIQQEMYSFGQSCV